MYAIIDIETTGGNARTDRIIDIAIILHNGERVVEEYATLVNPAGRYISPFIAGLTGITAELVEAAPLWEEIADKVDELTRDCIFVAHNVGFDYSFLYNEFLRMGRRYYRRRLCTVRLARNLIQGHHSYSLGKLCNKLDIAIVDRHRAHGDAIATAQLFTSLLNYDSKGIIKGALKDELAGSSLPPQLPRQVVADLPEETGVYYLRNNEGKILYIGKSNNIRTRILSHFGAQKMKKQGEGWEDIASIDYNITGSELLALLLESQEIKKWMPRLNKAEKRRKERYAIYLEEDEDGYKTLKLKLRALEGDCLKLFSYRRNAEEWLHNRIDKYGLCLEKCNLSSLAGPCLNTYSGTCLGACTSNEEVTDYNKRIDALVNTMRFAQPNFLIITEGRLPEENAVILIQEHNVRGFCTYTQDENLREEDILDRMENLSPHADLNSIASSYIKRYPKKLTLVTLAEERKQWLRE